MGNCLVLLGLKKEKSDVTLLLVGLDNAGKTTAAKGIVGDPVEDVAPTIGFAPEELEYRGCSITIYDLGGGVRIRPVWKNYFAEVHGVIFVVDASDPSRAEECKQVLINLLSHKQISGKPILLLANKQDVDAAMDEIDVCEKLDLECIVNRYKCPTRVETCSSITTNKGKPDKPIADGFRWLIDSIIAEYVQLNKRVKDDKEKQRLQFQRENDERRERIRRIREEREKEEQLRLQMRSSNTYSEAETSVPQTAEDTDDDVVIGRRRKNGEQDLGEANSRIKDVEHHDNSVEETWPKSSAPEVDQLSNSSDAKELRELGFTSAASLQQSSDSSSPEKDRDKEEVTKGAETKFNPTDSFESHRMVVVHRSPSKSTENENEGEFETSPASNHVQPDSPKSVIPAVPSPKSSLSSTMPSPTQSSCSNGGVHMNGSATVLHQLDFSKEEARDGECIPIDSDDEIFNLNAVDKYENETYYVPSTTPGLTSYVKEKLELEASNKPKKKSILRRYHKTAPLVYNDDQDPEMQAKVPPPMA
ncbi:uncharacterized protein LOC143021723 isoform X1 [Oratosquilla oratoria]|uniref:uncharacterized protein LOC143021723 isoform X1 n=1 Tax=Oratosquilla oratoria TaxID=337810 RepID=UPI003F764382